MPSFTSQTYTQGAYNVSITTDGSPMTVQTGDNPILLNQGRYTKITFTFADGASFYLTDFNETGYGYNEFKNVVGIPTSAGVYSNAIYAIPGYGYNTTFDIYDANTGVLLEDNFNLRNEIRTLNGNTLDSTFSPAVIFGYSSGGGLTLEAARGATSQSVDVTTSGDFAAYSGGWPGTYYTVANLTLSAPTPEGGDSTLTVGNHALTLMNIINNSSFVVNNLGSTLKFLGQLNAAGGCSQISNLNISDTANLVASHINTVGNLKSVSDQAIMNLIQNCAINLTPHNGTLPTIFNYSYLSNFVGSTSDFAIQSLNTSPYSCNFLNIVNGSLNQNCDISQFQGIVLVDKGVNVTGLNGFNQLGCLGGGVYTLNIPNQILYLLGGGGTVLGSTGLDTVCLQGITRESASISQLGDGRTVWCAWADTGTGVSNLLNVERILFSNGMIAFDTGLGENAGEIYRLYTAALNRSSDEQGLGYWLKALDEGTALTSIANQFINSNEFKSLFGSNLNDNQFVTALYTNVLDRAPDMAGLQYWLTALNSGMTREQILVSFSESLENVANSAQAIINGVQYQEYAFA